MGTARLSFIGVFYKLGFKECPMSELIIPAACCFLERPFASLVSRIARYAPSSTYKMSSLKIQHPARPNL